ncbi:MAG: phage head morphogenesis protein, partial [Bacteroidales bacterium]|nr:phage head morphogenesis protein [Bacteroidales bacterium]
MNSYLNTEYASVINKARSGKQFAYFLQHKDTMPNIEWLPSSALHPREAHIPYYYVVRPVDDTFWQENFPGNLWNCKCDWIATAKPVTNLPDKIVPPSKGLEGNPAITGKIFTNEASWLKYAGEEGRKIAELNIRKNAIKDALNSDLRSKVIKKQIEIEGQKQFINIG